jgi:FkbM family methyltransferase
MHRKLTERSIPKGLVNVPVQKVATDVGELWMPMSDQVLRDSLLSNGTWEPEIRALIIDAVQQANTFLDIGANVGYFSRLVARENPECQVHAFEPHPTTYSVLDLNTWEFGDRVHCWPVGLGDRTSVMGMRTEPNNLGDTHSVTDNFVDLLAPVVPLDSLLPELKADLVKIDVQGAELACIRGMLGVIARSPKIRIIVEFWPARLYEYGVPPETVLQAYQSMGFHIRYKRDGHWLSATNREILEVCAVSGRSAQADLLLSKF